MPEVVVALWTRTPILAGIELALGLVLLVAAAQRLVPKTAYRIIGGMATAFGIVLVGDPNTSRPRSAQAAAAAGYTPPSAS